MGNVWCCVQQMLTEHSLRGYVSEKMDPWVTQMGFPVVMVTRTAGGFHLTQKRFLIGSESGTDERYKDAPYE